MLRCVAASELNCVELCCPGLQEIVISLHMRHDSSMCDVFRLHITCLIYLCAEFVDSITVIGTFCSACCSVLQCVAVCCIVLHCVAVCCSRLQCAAVCVAVCCSVLHRVAACCSMLQCVAACGIVLQCVNRFQLSCIMPQINIKNACNTLQHTAIHCNTRQHTATHCNTLQHTAAY